MEIQLKPIYNNQSFNHALNIFNEGSGSGKLEIMCLRYLYQFRDKNNKSPTIIQLEKKTKELFEKYKCIYTSIEEKRKENIMEILSEISDIYYTHSQNDKNELIRSLEIFKRNCQRNNQRNNERNNERKNIQTNRVRRRIVEIDDDTIIKKKKVIKTVYEDKQNVHNTDVNKSVLKCMTNLYNQYKTKLEIGNEEQILKNKDYFMENIKNILIKKYENERNLLENSINYFKTNIATFGIGLTLRDTFICLYLWILQHKYKEELEKRLIEELKEMQGYCTTGRLARLVNVMQGYTDDEKFLIKMNEKDRTFSIVTTFLEKKIKECENENILDGMLSFTEDYKNYIREILTETILDWLKEGENLEDIVDSINKYCGCKIFIND
jgi:hypothetical protein